MGSKNHVGYFMIHLIFGVIRHAGHGLTEPCMIFRDAAYFRVIRHAGLGLTEPCMIFHDTAYFWGCQACRAWAHRTMYDIMIFHDTAHF